MTTPTPQPTSITVWTDKKHIVYIQIFIILFVDLACLAALIMGWAELGPWNQFVLISSIIMAPLYLSMYVLNVEFNQAKLVFQLPHKKRSFELAEIRHVRINKRMRNEYLEVKMEKYIGLRRTFSFVVDKNECEVITALNTLLSKGCKVYSNEKLDTRVFSIRQPGGLNIRKPLCTLEKLFLLFTKKVVERTFLFAMYPFLITNKKSMTFFS